MTSFNINMIAGIGIFFIVILLAVLFLLPTEDSKQRKKRRREEKKQKEYQAKQKDWERVALGLEKHKVTLHKEVEKLDKKVEVLDKGLVLEKAKVKKLQEKLLQERGWQEREQKTGDKKSKELKILQEEVKKIQETFSKEHIENLRLSSERKEVKASNDKLIAQKKVVDVELRKHEIKGEDYRKEISHLKKDVANLSKKEDDKMWVTMAEYKRVRKLLKEKETELARVSRTNKEEKKDE